VADRETDSPILRGLSTCVRKDARMLVRDSGDKRGTIGDRVGGSGNDWVVFLDMRMRWAAVQVPSMILILTAAIYAGRG